MRAQSEKSERLVSEIEGKLRDYKSTPVPSVCHLHGQQQQQEQMPMYTVATASQPMLANARLCQTSQYVNVAEQQQQQQVMNAYAPYTPYYVSYPDMLSSLSSSSGGAFSLYERAVDGRHSSFPKANFNLQSYTMPATNGNGNNNNNNSAI